jgi:hypothetical protein
MKDNAATSRRFTGAGLVEISLRRGRGDDEHSRSDGGGFTDCKWDVGVASRLGRKQNME